MHYGKVKDLLRTCRFKSRGKPINPKRTRRLHISMESPSDNLDDPRAIFELRYHKTTVIKWYPDGMIKASLRGYDTMSTHDCIKEHSPISIYTTLGSLWGHAGSRVWPGDEQTWFCSKDGDLCSEDGTPFPLGHFAHAPKLVPKRRSALVNTLNGDVLRDESGRHWICIDRASERLLVPYLGDHPLNRKFVINGSEESKELGSPLENLVLAASGWTVAERFFWKASTPEGE